VNQTVRGSLTYTVTPSRPTNARRTPNATACTSSQTPRPGAPGLGAASVADHDSSGRSDPQSARYQLLSPADIAYAYKLSRKTIYRAIERGDLRASRIGNRLRLRPEDCQTWLDSNTVSGETSIGAPIEAATSPARRRIRDLLDREQS